MTHPDIPEQTSQYSAPKPPEPQAGGMTADEAERMLDIYMKTNASDRLYREPFFRALSLSIAALRSHGRLVAACEAYGAAHNRILRRDCTCETCAAIKPIIAAVRPAAGRES